MARRKTGKVSAAPIQKRRVMSRSSELSSAEPAEIVRGSKAIPQIGQSPGRSRTISGCIGQVYSVPLDAFGFAASLPSGESVTVARLAGPGSKYAAGFASNFFRQLGLQK